MAKVVSIFRGQFLKDYLARQADSDFLTHSLFGLGVLATIVVPQIIYCIYGGPVSPWVLMVSAQAGVIAGLVNYIRPRALVHSIVVRHAAPVSQGDRIKRRKTS
jgi:hypothetical protein